MVGTHVARVAEAKVSCMEGDAMKPSVKGMSLFTPRQVEIIQCSARGLRVKEIADTLGVGVHTIKSHIQEMYRFSGCKSLAHAVAVLYGID